MELQKLKNLSDLIGKGTEIKKNTKTIKKEEEKFFMELLDNMCQIEAVKNNVKHIINTPLQLYKFLKQYDGK
jgi:predicted nuclease with TOPRIM domain